MLKERTPQVGFDAVEYWEGCDRGELLVQRCREVREGQIGSHGISAATARVRTSSGSGAPGKVWSRASP